MLLGALHSTHMMGLSQALLEQLVLMSNAILRATKNPKNLLFAFGLILQWGEVLLVFNIDYDVYMLAEIQRATFSCITNAENSVML
jgi:hypothetical protein